jgi:two-component system, NtrC family, nitrogen regulation sensor histidine kinase GlnL
MSEFAGLDLLGTAVVVVDGDLRVVYVNAAAEQLLELAAKTLTGQRLPDCFMATKQFEAKLRHAVARHWGFWDQSFTLERAGQPPLRLSCLATPIEAGPARLALEFRSIDQRLRIEREEREFNQAVANRELIRNLAHEIRNPLGGLRGSAQLLERELERPGLREYTQVIIKEADRLQQLMDRLLTPNRLPHLGRVNLHEVCERVRSLILAEFPHGIGIVRDYDASLPEIHGDREQLIQAVLNIVRNAAQALVATATERTTAGEIVLRTRIARSVTIARHRHRLALELQVIDNGPGIPPELRERMFRPLVSGRPGGTGLGLTLAQTHIQLHNGLIECESRHGRTVFRILLPLRVRTNP